MAQKELHSADVAPAQKKDIKLDLDTDLTLVRQNEEIALDSGVDHDFLAHEKFMHDKITIRLEQTSEKHAPKVISVGVNGRTEWLPVGQEIVVDRKYVEVLARCKSDNFETIAPEAGDREVVNRLHRKTSPKHPFTVIHDPSPKGHEWIRTVLAQ